MPDLPVVLDVRGQRCVVVGAGSVALRRARALLDAHAEVTVIAPVVNPGFEGLSLTLHKRPYRKNDVVGARLVVAATSDPAVNKAVSADARAAAIWVNRADEPADGDFAVPAHAHHGSVTIAVHTGGVSAAASATIRRQLSAALDPDWPRLLDAVSPWRRQIQNQIRDPGRRRHCLRELTGPQAMAILKQEGVEGLQQYCRRIAEGPARAGGSAFQVQEDDPEPPSV